ncbi:MAG: type II toxin-antitoxin system Phd/YefM family antitoxin [Myxococcota bacterium]|nr:type II toxin-antitoxin system Phd/YefM family antitoxin [Myxococcota bacterium]
METWQLQDAKNRFSELVERARAKGPLLVTRRGKPAVIVLSAEEYQRMVDKEDSSLDILLAAPRVGDELEIERDPSLPRSVSF